VRIGAKSASTVIVVSAVALTLGAAIWFGISHGIPVASDIANDIWPRLSARAMGVLSGRMPKVMLLVAGVMALETAVVGWRKSSLFRLGFRCRRSAIVDILFLLSVLLTLGGVLEIVLSLGVSIGATRIVNWVLSQYGWPRIMLPTDGIVHVLAGFGIYWLATTFLDYWGHRLMHAPGFWQLHRFHHAATELNVITVFRQHPVEPMILNFLSIVSPLIFFNVSDEILLVYFVWGTTFDLLAHSELPWGYGWFGRWVVASPCVHQIHHSVEDEHRDMHFSKCPLWDHLFGTWYNGEKVPSEYGIPENQYEVRPFRQFVYDPLTFYGTAGRMLLTLLAPRSRIVGWARSIGTKFAPTAPINQSPRPSDNAA
jgi:sterol desaturase/sphingolipid hydroxylase (fatty acid hydroxylase superfamily)